MIKLYSIVYKEINQLVHCGLFSFYTFSFLTIILLIRTSQDKPNHSFIISPLGKPSLKKNILLLTFINKDFTPLIIDKNH